MSRPAYYNVRACDQGSDQMRTIDNTTTILAGRAKVRQFFATGRYSCVMLVAMPANTAVFTRGTDPLRVCGSCAAGRHYCSGFCDCC